MRTSGKALGLDARRTACTVRTTGEVPLADEEFATLEENIGFVGLVMAAAMLVTLVVCDPLGQDRRRQLSSRSWRGWS